MKRNRCGAVLPEITNDRYRRPGATCRKLVRDGSGYCYLHAKAPDHENGSER